MKNEKILRNCLAAILVMACLMVSGCNKDSDNEGDYYMNAKIDGKSWSSHPGQLAAVVQGEYLFISGATGDEHELITINFMDFPGSPGTFPMGAGQYSFLCFYSIGDVSYHVFDDVQISSGVLVISSLQAGAVKGSFSFTGVTSDGDATVQVTEGSFSLPFFSGN